MSRWAKSDWSSAADCKVEMLAAAEVREEDEEYESPLDILFARLEMRNPESIAVKQYHVFKLGAGKTLKSIPVSYTHLDVYKRQAPKRPKMKLEKWDGDILSVLKRAERLLIENGQPERAKQMMEQFRTSVSYTHL